MDEETRPSDGSHPGHHLVSEVVYGPVESRRYDRSLGVNPFPGDRKVCTFDCLYCQLGWSRHGDLDRARPAQAEEVVEGVRSAANQLPAPPDAIVVSGNGEPTIHPRFSEFTEALIEARDRYLPGIPVICLTSGATMHRAATRDALRRYDECALKLDVGTDDALRRVNLPSGYVDLESIIAGARELETLVVQACFFEGILGNAAAEDVAEWIRAVRRLNPRRVDLYSITRAPATHRIHAVSRQRLQQIALELARDVPTLVRIFADEGDQNTAET